MPRIQRLWNTRRAAALLVAAGVLAVLFWVGLPWLAGAALGYLAQNAGLVDPHFAVGRLGWRQATLEEARFLFRNDAGTLAVDVAEARLDYTLGWRPALHAVRIGQAKLAWQESPPPPSGAGVAGAPGAIRPVLPFERLDVERLEVDVATGLGRSRFSGGAEMTVAADGGLEARLHDGGQVLRLALDPSGRQARLDAELAAGTPIFHAEAARRGDGPIRVTLDADANTLLEWLAATPLLPDTLRAQVGNVPEVRQGIASLAPRLAVTLDADPGTGSARLDGRLLHQGQAIAALQALRETGGAAAADLRLSAPLALIAPLAAPFLPPQASPWWPQAGDLRGRAQLRRSGAAWTGTAFLDASGVALQQGALSLAGGTLHLDITDLQAGAAEFSADVPSLRLGDKLEARHLAVRAAYRPGRLTVRKAEAKVFGGNLDIAPTDLDLNRRPLALTLRLADLDLATLLAALEQTDLSGEGRIGGELPLRIGDAGPEIDAGSLAGNGPGVLRYRGPVADPDNIAFKALRNLAYHSLKARLDYRPDGEYRIGLRLEGRNPELLAGHPVAFNLNLSGRLSELVRAGLWSGDWDRAILEEAEKQRREGAP